MLVPKIVKVNTFELILRNCDVFEELNRRDVVAVSDSTFENSEATSASGVDDGTAVAKDVNVANLQHRPELRKPGKDIQTILFNAHFLTKCVIS